MPQIGNKKFPYTPSGMKRANQIKKQLMARPTGGVRPGRPNRRPNLITRPLNKPPVGPGMKPSARPGMGATGQLTQLSGPMNKRRAM